MKQFMMSFIAMMAMCVMAETGVAGRLFIGKGDYANRSIFLPAAGYGTNTDLGTPVTRGVYWSSTPDSGNLKYAWFLNFESSLGGSANYRYMGRSVRPVR